MRILHLGPGMNNLSIPPKGWGGIEKIISGWTVELRKRGFYVEVINERNPHYIMECIRDRNFDIIHAYEQWAYQLLVDQRIDFLYTCQDSGWKMRWNEYLQMFKNARMVVVPQPLYNAIPEGIEKCMVPNGVDPNIFYPGEKIPKTCLCVGKHEPRKKFYEVAQVIAKHPDHHLYIIGPETECFKNFAPNITVIPNLLEKELSKYFRKCEYFFHMSDLETDALVVKEAALSCCKLILSPYCSETFGPEASITDMENFQNCPLDFGEKAREIALKHSTWEKVVDNLVIGYERCVNKYNQEKDNFHNPPRKQYQNKNYNEFLKDKKVVIIGPAQTVKNSNQGELIESYDYVVRVNRALPVPQDLEKDIGKRTDILYNCLNPSEITGGGILKLNILQAAGVKYISCPYPPVWPFVPDFQRYVNSELKNYFGFHHIHPDHYGFYVKKMRTRPNSGLGAIIDLLMYDLKELYITGFTFFQTPFYKEYRDTTPEALNKLLDDSNGDKKPKPTHELEPQLKLMKFFYDEDKRVKVDKPLQNILKHPENWKGY